MMVQLAIGRGTQQHDTASDSTTTMTSLTILASDPYYVSGSENGAYFITVYGTTSFTLSAYTSTTSGNTSNDGSLVWILIIAALVLLLIIVVMIHWQCKRHAHKRTASASSFINIDSSSHLPSSADDQSILMDDKNCNVLSDAPSTTIELSTV
jgi:ABC-type phosphate transport system permease subunit